MGTVHQMADHCEPDRFGTAVDAVISKLEGLKEHVDREARESVARHAAQQSKLLKNANQRHNRLAHKVNGIDQRLRALESQKDC